MAKQIALVYSRALVGIEAREVWIEVDLIPAVPNFFIVGLPEAAVKEAGHRVKSAIQNAGYIYPPFRVVVNLGPADFVKTGSAFDLAIAIAILIASNQIDANDCQGYEFFGELALSGQCCGASGSLVASYATHQAGRTLILPEENAQEALLVEGARVIGFKHLSDVVEHLRGHTIQPMSQAKKSLRKHSKTNIAEVEGNNG